MTTTVATRGSAPTSDRAGAWTLVGVQYGFSALYALCGYLAMARAADLAGHWYIPAQGDAVTADLDISSGWVWTLPVGVVLSLGPVLAGLGLFVSVMAFLLGYTHGRRHVYALIGSTVAMLLVLVVSLTPAAQSVSGWLLD
ncbi:hypothetical protein JIG36_00450 [Actinoplanes sp. LDG1-06]|uniref:DoxX family protein n=1 Tax=Paractinoplanes ovalisporus TaxID=2810368 RepID=A0ABS2A2G7_9ACTN|nr:hypothetical protein [Actinoplanes ovalisporus]MBM2614024.1 hypothetical protein [Actinoplanes ovalisporus]